MAAAPRASGYTSVIPTFRQYPSQGYSTLRHTCSFMRKCCNVLSESIFPIDLCFYLIWTLAWPAPLTISLTRSGVETVHHCSFTYMRGLTDVSFQYQLSVKNWRLPPILDKVKMLRSSFSALIDFHSRFLLKKKKEKEKKRGQFRKDCY